jgi:hypothetical protein
LFTKVETIPQAVQEEKERKLNKGKEVLIPTQTETGILSSNRIGERK